MLYFIKKHILRSKDIPRRYDQIFTEIKRLKPKNIMEIGVWSGERARRMIEIASRYNKPTTINYFGFDFFERMDSETFQKEVSKQPPPQEVVQSKLLKTGASINLIKGDTTQTLRNEQGKHPSMDIIFIDGGHSLETVESDWQNAKTFMHKGSVLIFDDYWTNRIDAGAKRTVDAIDRNEFSVEIMPVVDSFDNTSFGRLVIQLAKVTKL